MDVKQKHRQPSGTKVNIIFLSFYRSYIARKLRNEMICHNTAIGNIYKLILIKVTETQTPAVKTINGITVCR